MWLGILALGAVLTVMIVRQRSMRYQINQLQYELDAAKKGKSENEEVVEKKKKEMDKVSSEKLENNDQMKAAYVLLEKYSSKLGHNAKKEGVNEEYSKESKEERKALTKKIDYAGAFE